MRYTETQLSDIQSIRDATLRYSRGVDRLDAALMRSAYWEDATDDHGVFKGNAWEFVDFVMATHERWWSTMHSVFNHAIELEPDGRAASGELYNLTTMFRHGADGPVLDTWYGRYLDRYVKRGDEWRIAERVCVHEATTMQPIAAMMPLDTAAFRQGSFDRRAPGRSLGP